MQKQLATGDPYEIFQQDSNVRKDKGIDFVNTARYLDRIGASFGIHTRAVIYASVLYNRSCNDDRGYGLLHARR
jgi:hypothetical protein